MNEIKLIIPLLTHVRKTKNKIKSDKYMKINNQAIYNGNLNHFSRAIVVEYLHEHFSDNIEPKFKGLNIDSRNIKLLYEFHTVLNHGDVRRTKYNLLNYETTNTRLYRTENKYSRSTSSTYFIWRNITFYISIFSRVSDK